MARQRTSTPNNFKRVKTEFLLLQVLQEIESNGRNISKISKKLNITKQALNYHLNKVKRAGLVRRIQSYPFAIYELTELGQRVKEILGQSERGAKLPTLWDAHNLIVGFDVIDFGKYHFEETKRRKLCFMNNWIYTKEDIDGYGVHVQNTGLIKIYCKRMRTTNPEQAFANMYSDAIRIAQTYCNRYNMKLKPMRIIREGHKSLYNSEVVAKLFGRFKIGDIWQDASSGIEELEEKQNSNKIEELLNLPEQMNQMMVLQEKFSKNIELHLDVLQNINTAITELRHTIKNGDAK